MKARESDKTLTRKLVMLQAADLIEQKARYNFDVCRVPDSCDDAGCVLGWIGFCAGFRGLGQLDSISGWAGYPNAMRFYDAMWEADGTEMWTDDPTIAAQTLRKLAEEIK